MAGRYFDNTSPVNGRLLCAVARSDEQDIEAALDAAHAAREAWGRTSVAERSLLLNRIAQVMEDHLALLAQAETWDNGKPIRETMAADIPLAIDHFRYFAGVRPRPGRLDRSEIDHDTVAYHFHEPLGVVAQIIPVEFPDPDGGRGSLHRRLPPAIASSSSLPNRHRPRSSCWIELDRRSSCRRAFVNIVNGFGLEAGKPLATNPAALTRSRSPAKPRPAG